MAPHHWESMNRFRIRVFAFRCSLDHCHTMYHDGLDVVYFTQLEKDCKLDVFEDIPILEKKVSSWFKFTCSIETRSRNRDIIKNPCNLSTRSTKNTLDLPWTKKCHFVNRKEKQLVYNYEVSCVRVAWTSWTCKNSLPKTSLESSYGGNETERFMVLLIL